MKIAVCLFGYPKGSTVYAGGAYEQKFKYLFEEVMIHNPDVFIHSWDQSIKQEMVDIFSPKYYIFEKQKKFNDLKSMIDLSRFEGSRGDIQKTLSFLYTRKKSNDLKKIYEQENDFIYDCVLSCRFDLGYHNYGKNKTSYIKFDTTLNMNCIYSAFWNQINAGVSDHWYYSNSNNMDKVSNIFLKVIDYLKKDSEYCKTMLNGWIDSNEEDEFSNEFLKSTKSDNKKKYPEHYCLNNHCLYKWHFYKNNLWDPEVCRFLNEELWK
jgi:hypothetical protein